MRVKTIPSKEIKHLCAFKKCCLYGKKTVLSDSEEEDIGVEPQDDQEVVKESANVHVEKGKSIEGSGSMTKTEKKHTTDDVKIFEGEIVVALKLASQLLPSMVPGFLIP